MVIPRRIILSRKGFDSTKLYGGTPSPIIDGKWLLSLPIPESKKPTIQYSHLSDPSGYFHDLGPIVDQLTNGGIKGESYAHLDPDLRLESLDRAKGWRPIFGQVGQSQTHLCKQGVAQGDLFLFYGLYRDAVVNDGKITYTMGTPRKHVIWGWMGIGDILKVSSENDGPTWARYHPHFTDKRGANNTVYVSSDKVFETLPGAGVFEIYSPELCLSDGAQKRASRWKLPKWFAPRNGHYALTYHHREDCWNLRGDCVLLQTKSPGQEFVLNTTVYPEALLWAEELIKSSSRVANP